MRTPIEILHYVPSSFASSEASRALITLLNTRQSTHKLIVVLHGLHSCGENRLLNDTPCPNQAETHKLILQSADSVIALSGSSAKVCNTWRSIYQGKARILRIDHPGLFAQAESVSKTHSSYAFIGGISRSKKIHTNYSISMLLEMCREQGVRVWEHWSNIRPPLRISQAWKQTSGLLSDIEWSGLISNARVVLCPYTTQIQTVSGLLSEALSVGRFVLSTSFELSIEMKLLFPKLVLIEDNIERWPALIQQLPQLPLSITAGIPTWDSFAQSIVLEIIASKSDNLLLHKASHYNNISIGNTGVLRNDYSS